MPYALTLWTFLQSEEANYFASLIRESERLDEANMIASGMSSDGNRMILSRMRSLDLKTRAPVATESREEMARRADELWARHHRSNKMVS